MSSSVTKRDDLALKTKPAQAPRSGTGSKYDVLTRPSQRLIDVSKALQTASQRLGLFRG